MTDLAQSIVTRADGPTARIPEQAGARAKRPSGKRLAIAFALAAASDVLSLWVDIILPVQWALDLVTAILLFMILGRRWALLPGLIAEAIPGLGFFPVWVLVVLSIMLYDDVRARRR